MEPGAKVKKKNKKNTGIIIIGTVFVAIIIILLIFLMQGKTTTSGNYPENVSDEALNCEANNIDYPFFAYDNTTKKTAKISILFSKDKMKSIALAYSLYYDDATSITTSEAHNHAAMNKSFAADGLKKADAYNAKYARMEDRMQLNLYATASDFDNIAKRYFFIENDKTIPESIETYKSVYEKVGFKCEKVKN